MEKALKTVQTISKVMSILAKIAFVCTIIGAAGSLLGGISLFSVPLLGETVADIIVSETGAESVIGLGVGLIAVCIFLIGTAIALGFVCQYFKHELADGTPFTHNGAAELLRVGIISLAVPFGALIFSSAVAAFSGASNAISLEFNATSGIAMILLSYVFSYGAHLADSKSDNEQN